MPGIFWNDDDDDPFDDNEIVGIEAINGIIDGANKNGIEGQANTFFLIRFCTAIMGSSAAPFRLVMYAAASLARALKSAHDRGYWN